VTRVGRWAAVWWCCLAMSTVAAMTVAPDVPPSQPLSAVVGARKPTTFNDALWWFRAMRLRKVQRDVTGEGVRVALVDNALDPTVPELRGQRVRKRQVCGKAGAKPTSGASASYHGTAMAALIVGSGRGDGPGGRGVPGVAPDARLLFYGVDARPRTDTIDCSPDAIAAVVDTAVDEGADIINMSLGGMSSEAFARSITRALRAGVVVVAAIGNRGDRFDYSYPAWYPGVVAVGGVDQRLRPWRGAPRDDNTTVVAPAARVGSGGGGPEGWTSLVYVSGTSAATAITSGALALLKSKYPTATGSQLIQHLIHTAAGRKGFEWRLRHGFGMVNVSRMLASSPTQWPDENPLMLPTARAVEDYPRWTSSRVDDPPQRQRAPSADRTYGRKVGSAPLSPDDEPADMRASGLRDLVSAGADRAWLWSAVGVGLVALVVVRARKGRRRG